MLDRETLDQLKNAFAPLQDKIELVYLETDHPDQASLLELLSQVAQTNANLKVTKQEGDRGVGQPPQFFLQRNGKPVGIRYKGIPGGHEFTSLIVGILNTGGLGRIPDQSLQTRIKSLKGPIRLKTYISLTCENCPEVVQALQQMALIHPDMVHEMVDGHYTQEEIQSLNIQGVPSVVESFHLLHSGKSHLLDLIEKLEEHFGTNYEITEGGGVDLGKFDVTVIGSGPAGVSAAVYSVRKGLKTAIVGERVGGQVMDTKGIENMISIPYTEGPQLAASLQQHLESYPIQILGSRRVSRIDREDKTIFFENGDKLTSDQIIIATGAKWRELHVPGEKEYTGRGVAYCPHCDGPFYKGKKVAVVGGGNSGVEAAVDLAGIVGEVVLFEFNEKLKADKVLVDKLKSLPNTKIITGAKTKELKGNGQKIVSLIYEDRKTQEVKEEPLEGVFIQIGLLPNSQFLKETVDMNKFGEIIVDGSGRTSAKGIYAAGDVTTTPFKQIIISMGEGAKAALAAFEDRMYGH